MAEEHNLCGCPECDCDCPTQEEAEATNSTHQVEVVPVTLERHPNADLLSIVHIEGYQAIVRTDEWKDGDLGAYVPPDNLVPLDRPEFAFLKDPDRPDKKQKRVKARNIRGEWSMGVLVHAPAGSNVGDDVAKILGVEHYNPPEPPAKLGGQSCRAPILPGFGVPINYDVESFRKYGRRVFKEDELVWVTEKIHGTNARFVYSDGKMHAGSHKNWKRPEVPCLWWKTVEQYPGLAKFCEENPNTVVYGEIYGVQKELKYGLKSGETRLAIFDIFQDGEWVKAQRVDTICRKNDIPMVPVVGIYYFDFEELLALAEGNTLIPGVDHLREGIVIKPMRERWENRVGRINLKVVSNKYLEGKGKK